MTKINNHVKKKLRLFLGSAPIIILSLVSLIPFILMVLTSLKSYSEVNSETFVFIPKVPQIKNYAEAMTTGNWGRYFTNSLYVTLITTFICTLFNSLAGYAFARLDFKFKKPLFFSQMVGLMISQQVIMVPVFIISKHIPLFGGNNILGQGGTGWINSYWGLIVPYVAGAYGVFMFRQFFMNFPKALDDAAEIDGCTKLGLFLKIYLPNSMPVFASFMVLKITDTWNSYLWPLVVTNSDSMKTVQVALANFKNDVVEWEILMAATTVITVPIIAVFLLAQRYFIEGLVTSGLKG